MTIPSHGFHPERTYRNLQRSVPHIIAVRATAWTREGSALRLPAFVRIRGHFRKLAQRVSDVLPLEKLISSFGHLPVV
jgi:hypothetical protein